MTTSPLNPYTKALEIWGIMLYELQEREAMTIDRRQRSTIRHKIKEAKARIAQLARATRRRKDQNQTTRRIIMPTPYNPNSAALEIWRRKLQYLKQQQPLITDPNQKFALAESIAEANAKITELTTQQQPRVARSPTQIPTPLTKSAVHRVAQRLMKIHGSTTNLGVKEHLRGEGFTATQPQVSGYMHQLATEKGWSTNPVGRYCIFTLRPMRRPTPPKTQQSGKPPPTIVLLTANQHETDAVLRIFTRPGERPRQVACPGTTYDNLGIHGGINVLHTICEMGTAGVGAALQRTTSAVFQWEPVAIIAVGIAFGLKEKTQKIGDVLVSSKLQDYDLAKVTGRSTTIPRGDRVTASPTLLSCLRSTNGIKRSRNAKWPKVTFGLLLSGQKLVNSFTYRTRLKRMYPDAIGGEMEGIGVYVASASSKVDWIVVKGICDWGYKKNTQDEEASQALAATNAATVVKAALDASPTF